MGALTLGQKCLLILWIVFILAIIYRKLRANFGRQPLRRGHMSVRLILLLLIMAMMLPGSHQSPPVILSTLVGLLLGLGLAFWSTRKIVFERDMQGNFYYTPHRYPGYFIVALFLSRLCYRMTMMLYFSTSADFELADINMMSPTPLTRTIICIVISYYIYYNSYIMLKARK